MSAPARLLTLVQAIGIGTLALVMMFPHRRWSRAARIPVAGIVFVASTESLFSHIL